ncbi:MAG: cytochrome c3 family protein [Deltaproteobacteria bacterium]|nr:cytochrome c3 family protein [Deltaproteobacteria bacterium]
MKIRKRTVEGAAALLGVAVAMSALAGVPPGKAVIILSDVPGDKSAVAFPHAKHVDQFRKLGGAAIVCRDCHHTLTTAMATGETPQICPACHVKEGTPQITVNGRTAPFLFRSKAGRADVTTIIYHKRCRDSCHLSMKAEGKIITTCKTCHNR